MDVGVHLGRDCAGIAQPTVLEASLKALVKADRGHWCANTIGLGVHRDGAFAEYAVLPAENAWVHRGAGTRQGAGEKLDLDVAAIFDPFGNAVHTALAFPVLGEDVLITGAGP